jgi:hypothetical protein
VLGDIALRLPTLGPDSAPGVKDVFWLASYPLLIAAVAAMIRARGLPRALHRDIGLDVIVVSAAACIGGWRLATGDWSSLTGSVIVGAPLGRRSASAHMKPPGRRPTWPTASNDHNPALGHGDVDERGVDHALHGISAAKRAAPATAGPSTRDTGAPIKPCRWISESTPLPGAQPARARGTGADTIDRSIRVFMPLPSEPA